MNLPKGWRVVAGHHAIREAFNVNSQWIQKLWVRQGWESRQELNEMAQWAKKNKTEWQVKPVAELDKLSTAHQGALLFLSEAPQVNWDKLNQNPNSIIILLDGIEDPHNLGAILRTTWLMGGDGILIPKDQAVGLTASVHKVASGAVEHVPVEACSNFSHLIKECKENGYWVFGLSHKAKREIYSFKLPAKIIWAIGSEDRGLRSTTEKLCDELVSIPQVNAEASYNASVAAALALAETRRQQSNVG